MTQAEMKEFVRYHFAEFVNRRNLDLGEVNFAPKFADDRADVACRLAPPGPSDMWEVHTRNSRTLPVEIPDPVAEDEDARS
jgi:hypothetical protein